MRHMDKRALAPSPAFGVNLFGYLTSNLGLGVAARNTAHMLLANDVPTRLVDVNPGGGMQGRDTQFAERISVDRAMPSFSVNLFHINPDQVLYLLGPRGGVDLSERRANVCVPFWELPRLPQSWHRPLAAMDAILAPTHFIERAILSDSPDAHVIHYPQAVHLPKGISASRAAFGLPDAAFTFVMSFDMRSDIERKNPWAVIDAFLLAFPDRRDVRLVIKANNVDTIAGLGRHVQRLRDVGVDDRISIIDRPMAYVEVLSLYASCDALVSLHRAEGLGLSLLEAMALGMPVIATGWSGNMDFMTEENSCLVGFDMIDVVSSTQPAYGKGTSGRQQWAEPRVAEAAAWMRRLAEEPSLARSIGDCASSDVASLVASHDSGNGIPHALATLVDSAVPPEARNAAHNQMRHLQRLYPYHMARRLARAGWYRLRTATGFGQ